MPEEINEIEVEGEIVETVEPIDTKDLIVVKQIPIIEERLQQIKSKIQADVDSALTLECTEETKKQIKEIRKNLNKQFKELEDSRKAVKNKVLEPYNHFEAIYKECVTNIFKPADEALKNKIDAVECVQKQEKEKKAKSFFTELCEAKGIDFLKFENVGLNISLSISDKKCKEEVENFINRVYGELALIDTQPYKDEILVEYKESLNVSTAITRVTTRHKLIEEEKARQVEAEARAKAEAEKEAIAQAAIDESEAEQTDFGFTPFGPVEDAIPEEEQAYVPEEEPVTSTHDTQKQYKINFDVEGTIDDFKAMKQLFEERGMTYEQHK